MKKIIIITGILAILLTSLSCTRELPLPVRNLNIEFKLPENFRSDIKYANQEVVFTSTSATYKYTTNSDGMLVIPELIPDEYSISTSWKMTGTEYKELITDGELVEDKATVVLKAGIGRKKLFTKEDIELVLDKLVLKSLLISKVYYTGTKDNANKNYIVDAYVEIYNNSEDTVYIDGKYLALAESMSPPAYPAKDHPDYIYARQICKFPGEGNDNPVAPGKSIVIAAKNARDHRTSASTSIDLSDADFEVKEADGMGNPDVKALPILSNSLTIKFFNLMTGGGNAVFIFETNEDILSWPQYYAPGKTSGERFRRVPVSVVLDGVECLKNNASTGPDINLKRFQTIVDAGFAYTNATSGYTHESIERKVSSVEGNRFILKDVNNSTEDFVITLDPTPRKYDKPELLN